MVLDEPAAAGAAARCLAARAVDRGHWTTRAHPTRCGWCVYPTDRLDSMLRGYGALVDFDERNGTATSGASAFRRLAAEEQARQIVVAQALEPSLPPAPLAPAEPAEATPEPVTDVAWLP
jgi:hypothetical protein